MLRLDRFFYNAVHFDQLRELEFEINHSTAPEQEICNWANKILIDYATGGTYNVKIIDLLLKHSSIGVDYCYDDYLLQLAVKLPYPNFQLIHRILKYGADSKWTNRIDGNCLALHSVIQNPKAKLEVIELLLRHGADPNMENIKEAYFNSMHYALRNPDVRPEVIELLLNFGGDVHGRAVDYDTPLHFAVRNERINVDAVNVLLKHGANMHMLNCDGHSPLQEALSNCYKQQDCNARAHTKHYAEGQHSTVLCVKLMLKHCILNKTDCDFSHVINLEAGVMCQILLDDVCSRTISRLHNYSNFVSFIKQCVNEIIQMKNNYVSSSLSLYKYVVSREECISTGIQIDMDNILRILTENSYPIYNDRIISDIKRDDLWNSLHLIKVCSAQQNCVFLDLDNTYKLAEYLSNNDLLNLLLAFYSSTDSNVPKKKQKKC